MEREAEQAIRALMPRIRRERFTGLRLGKNRMTSPDVTFLFSFLFAVKCLMP